MIVKKNSDLIETKEITKYGKDIDKLMTTEMGIIVHDFLDKWFENIVNYQFTANLEKQLDIVASGKLDWLIEEKFCSTSRVCSDSFIIYLTFLHI